MAVWCRQTVDGEVTDEELAAELGRYRDVRVVRRPDREGAVAAPRTEARFALSEPARERISSRSSVKYRAATSTSSASRTNGLLFLK